MNAARSAPPALEALQVALQQHLLGCVTASWSLQAAIRPGGIGPAHRLGIYHHAYRARLIETLRDSFGHTHGYLGDAGFDAEALAFVERHPSSHANLRCYGEGFAAWLAARLPGDGEVGELAALDWALRRAFDSADAPALALSDLAGQPPEAWVHAPLHLQDGAALLHFGFNTLALWQALDDERPPPAPATLPAPGDVLVWRIGHRPHFRSLAAPEAAALAQALRGSSFATLCESLAQDFPALDAASTAGAMLKRWADDGLLCRP